VLVALIAAFLLGGASGTSGLLATLDQAQASVKTQVEDRARRAELVAVLESAKKVMKGALESRGETTEELVELLGSYEAKAADSQPMVQRMHADAEAAQAQVIRSRFELKDRMSREEWRKVFSQR
jgi:cell division protein FtsX